MEEIECSTNEASISMSYTVYHSPMSSDFIRMDSEVYLISKFQFTERLEKETEMEKTRPPCAETEENTQGSENIRFGSLLSSYTGRSRYLFS